MIGSAATELVPSDDAKAALCYERVAVANVIAGHAGTAVDQQYDVRALAGAVGHHFVTVHGHAPHLIRLTFLHLAHPPQIPGRRLPPTISVCGNQSKPAADCGRVGRVTGRRSIYLGRWRRSLLHIEANRRLPRSLARGGATQVKSPTASHPSPAGPRSTRADRVSRGAGLLSMKWSTLKTDEQQLRARCRAHPRRRTGSRRHGQERIAAPQSGRSAAS